MRAFEVGEVASLATRSPLATFKEFESRRMSAF